uniref:Uncharacterized protein n=1 Tax=Solanum tuberosum TaxID=4113 RepID=M1DD93_SOLTU
MVFHGMTNTRANARRDKKGHVDQEVPLQVTPQVPPQANQAPINPSAMYDAEVLEKSDYPKFEAMEHVRA